jgi:hypothetical protein
VPAGTRIDEIVVEAGRLLAATQVADMPSSASAVCYAGEMSGAYLGTLDRDEVAVALREIAGGLLHVLRSGLAEKKAAQLDAPPFAADGYELAAWLLTLRELAGSGEEVAGAMTDLATLTRRLGDLVPRMPEGATREAMSALRRVLDERSASQVIRTLQLSLTS